MNTSTREGYGSNTVGGGSPADAARKIPVRDNRIDSRELFVGTREITIVHGDDAYRLRLTAQNKLILTK
jgi:hemin uptake protein HemP